MVYFVVEELIGRNCKEAYQYYLFQVNWLSENLQLENWQLDYSVTLCYNGVNIAGGIYINNLKDASRFCSECL